MDISQKLFQKILGEQEGDFESLICLKLQVINSKLILEQSHSDYLVQEVHKKSGYFTYKNESGKLASEQEAR